MRISPRYPAIAATVLIAIAAASCDSHKATTPSPIGPTPTTPASPSNVRLELNAPASIAPGVSVQLGVNVVKSDNSVQNVTAQSQWFSSNARVIEVNPAGVAKGNALGEAVITVRYLSLRASTEALVLPDGTYRVKGTVTDAGVGLGGVTITVIGGIGGIGDGLVATSDGNGAYGLYGVRGRLRLQAKRDGYLNRIEEVDATENRLLDLAMTLDRARPDLGGRYTLTMARMPCAGDVPDVRSYDATVQQNGPRLAVTLGGADFIVTRGHGNGFSGLMEGPDRVTFTLGAAYSYYYYYGQYDVIERISSSSALIVDGTATTTISPARISGTLNGEFLLVQGSAAPFTRILGRCSGSAHRFEMVRR